MRVATVEDAPAIARLHVDAWRAAYRELLPARVLADLSVAERADRWRDWIAGATTVLIADGAGGEPLGFCAIAHPDAGPPEIAALYVAPARTGAGIGSALLAEALDRLTGRADEAVLWVLAGNTGARRLYERFGFAADGAAADAHGAREIRMRVRLASSAT